MNTYRCETGEDMAGGTVQSQCESLVADVHTSHLGDENRTFELLNSLSTADHTQAATSQSGVSLDQN